MRIDYLIRLLQKMQEFYPGSHVSTASDEGLQFHTYVDGPAWKVPPVVPDKVYLGVVRLHDGGVSVGGSDRKNNALKEILCEPDASY